MCRNYRKDTRNINSSWPDKLKDPKKYSKRFGQVFLTDRNIAKLEASLLDLPAGSGILEIGPGEGMLTRYLLNNGYVVTAVESDHRFVESLQTDLKAEIDSGKLNVVKSDFLKYGPADFQGVTGNVPYHISSEILFHLDNFSFAIAVMMFQKEFARRMIAFPGSSDYSRLSVNVQLRYNVESVRVVPRSCFSPRPEVDSMIIRLKPLKRLDTKSLREADCVFRILFSNRRKKISSILPVKGEIGNNRCEDLTPQQLYDLATEYLRENSYPC